MDDNLFTLLDSIAPKDGDGDDGPDVMEEGLRMACLEYALRSHGGWGDHDEIIASAEDFYTFIKGGYFIE